MITKFFDSDTDLWAHITAEIRKKPASCLIAVPYIGKGASKLLPLIEGSILVVDASESSVKNGTTNPYEIALLLKHGVSVHSVNNLHAKLYIIDKKMFIGSCNASNNSRDFLIEAAILTEDKNIVKEGRKFISKLMGNEITPEQARALQAIYCPPQFLNKHSKKSKNNAVPIWIVNLVNEKWTDKTYKIDDNEFMIAERKIENSRYYRVENFLWEGDKLIDNIKLNDKVIQIYEEKRNHKLISPPYNVVHIKKFEDAGKMKALIYLEGSNAIRRKNFEYLKNRVDNELIKRIKQRSYIRISSEQTYKILNTLWNS